MGFIDRFEILFIAMDYKTWAEMVSAQLEVCIDISDLKNTVYTRFGWYRLELNPEKKAGMQVVIGIAHW